MIINENQYWKEMKTREIDLNLITDLSYKHYNENHYKLAVTYLLQAIELEPQNYLYKSMIGICYYELREYELAFEWAKKAYSMHSSDPIVSWNYAIALEGKDLYKESNKILIMIINRGVYNIGFIDCQRGTRWARTLYNDCYFQIAENYYYLNDYKNSIKYYNLHLELRKRGIASVFEKSWVLKSLKRAEKLKQKWIEWKKRK